MTDEQFEKFMAMMQAQTEAINRLADSLAPSICNEINALRKVEVLNTALSLCKSKSTENTPLQESGGLTGAINDINKFCDTAKTPDNWKDYVTNEIYIKTFSGKPLKIEDIG